MRGDDWIEDEDEEEDDEPRRPSSIRRRPRTQRVYVHQTCGGQTRISGFQFTHLCDPFWPCTGTYCCTCADYAALDEVSWTDTGEALDKFRSRMRRRTPALLQIWRFGVGFLVGGVLGAAAGLVLAVARHAARKDYAGYGTVGAMLGAVAVYLLGTILLNLLLDVNYRRMK